MRARLRCCRANRQRTPNHAAFVAAMRASYGRVLTARRPRITRLRPGATSFTLVDPSGNSIIFIQPGEPPDRRDRGRLVGAGSTAAASDRSYGRARCRGRRVMVPGGSQGIQGALNVPVSLRIAVQSSPAQMLLILPWLRR
jgi:hypothetical protein